MKTYKITKAEDVMEKRDYQNLSKEILIQGPSEMSVSDGYHTMDELYEHRIQLFITLCKFLKKAQAQDGQIGIFSQPWRSRRHGDGTIFEGWFIMGINKEPGTQISYHLPDSKWAETDFVETLNNAPVFDGHTSNDVLSRLKVL